MTAHPQADRNLIDQEARDLADAMRDDFHALPAPTGETGPKALQAMPQGERDRAESSGGDSAELPLPTHSDPSTSPSDGSETGPIASESAASVRPRPSGPYHPASPSGASRHPAAVVAGGGGEEDENFVALIDIARRAARAAVSCPPMRAGIGTAALAAEALVLAGRLDVLWKRGVDE